MVTEIYEVNNLAKYYEERELRSITAIGTHCAPGQRVAHRFETQEPLPLELFQAVYRSNVGMVQRGKEFGFAFKPCETVRIFRELFGQCLDRYFTSKFRVPRTPHLQDLFRPSLHQIRAVHHRMSRKRSFTFWATVTAS